MTSPFSHSNPFLPEDDIHLILTLRLPTKHRSAETAPWISLACNIADVLYQQQKLLPEVQVTKLVRSCRACMLTVLAFSADSPLSCEQKKRRAEVLAGLVKAAAEEQKLSAQEQKEQAAVLKRKLEKEKEEAKLRTMSRSERIKYLVSRVLAREED